MSRGPLDLGGALERPRRSSFLPDDAAASDGGGPGGFARPSCEERFLPSFFSFAAAAEGGAELVFSFFSFFSFGAFTALESFVLAAAGGSAAVLFSLSYPMGTTRQGSWPEIMPHGQSTSEADR